MDFQTPLHSRNQVHIFFLLNGQWIAILTEISSTSSVCLILKYLYKRWKMTWAFKWKSLRCQGPRCTICKSGAGWLEFLTFHLTAWHFKTHPQSPEVRWSGSPTLLLAPRDLVGGLFPLFKSLRGVQSSPETVKLKSCEQSQSRTSSLLFNEKPQKLEICNYLPT